jgi:glucitol operon activator protein
MWSWQTVLALLAFAWFLQCIGTLVQIRRYRAAFRELSNGWSDGWMGVGKGSSLIKGGAVVMIVVAPDETVRRAVVLKGRTVFAKAERIGRLEGRRIGTIRQEASADPKDPVSAGILGALDQIAGARTRSGAVAEADGFASARA